MSLLPHPHYFTPWAASLFLQAWTAKQTNPPITVEWVSHARWVHNEGSKYWTSSGVSAGMDMTAAFLDEVAGPAGGLEARAFCEYTQVLPTTHAAMSLMTSANPQGDDPWADALGL